MNSPVYSVSNFIESLLDLSFKSNQDSVNNNSKLVSSYLLAGNLLKQYLAEKVPALYSRIAAQLALHSNSLRDLSIQDSSRKGFLYLSSLVRKNKEMIERKPGRHVREIKDSSDNGEIENILDTRTPQKKPATPWRNPRERDVKPLRPLVRDRERPNDALLTQSFMNPRAQSGFRNKNGWNNRNNIPHSRRPPPKNVVCYRCLIPGHVAPDCRKYAGPTSKSPCTTCFNKTGREYFHTDCGRSNRESIPDVNFIHVAPRASKNGLRQGF